jgi:hypothetical protein
MFSVAGTNMLIYHQNFRWIQVLLCIYLLNKKKMFFNFLFRHYIRAFFPILLLIFLYISVAVVVPLLLYVRQGKVRRRKKERKYFSMSEVNFQKKAFFTLISGPEDKYGRLDDLSGN